MKAAPLTLDSSKILTPKKRRVLFYRRDNRGEKSLTASLMKGIQKHGDECRTVLSTDFLKDPDWGGAEVVFIGRSLPGSKIVIEAARRDKVQFVYYDKGYFNRGWKTEDPQVYYRFSVNNFQPLEYFQAVPRPPDRWQKLAIELEPRKKGSSIVVAGYSEKFAAFFGVDAKKHTDEMIHAIQKKTDKPIAYRARTTPGSTEGFNSKPKGQEARKMQDLFENAHALVTFASNAAADAVIAGVPAFTLGPSIARPVSNTDLSLINDPWFPSEKERLQWACDLAYCQWRVEEMEDGSLWQSLKEVLSRGT